jgi:hypothetical protein
VIVRYPTAIASQLGYTVVGGTITNSGGYTIHSFTTVGTSSLRIS